MGLSELWTDVCGNCRAKHEVTALQNCHALVPPSLDSVNTNTDRTGVCQNCKAKYDIDAVL